MHSLRFSRAQAGSVSQVHFGWRWGFCPVMDLLGLQIVPRDRLVSGSEAVDLTWNLVF